MPDTKTNSLTFKVSEFDGFEFPSYLNNFTAQELKGAKISVLDIENASWLNERIEDDTQKVSDFIKRIGRNVVSTIQLEGDSEVQDLIIPIGTFMTSKGIECASSGDVTVPADAKSVSKVLKAKAVQDGQTQIPTHIRVLDVETLMVTVNTVKYPKHRFTDYEGYDADIYKSHKGAMKTAYINDLIVGGVLKEDRNPMIEVSLGLVTA